MYKAGGNTNGHVGLKNPINPTFCRLLDGGGDWYVREGMPILQCVKYEVLIYDVLSYIFSILGASSTAQDTGKLTTFA